MARTIRGPRPNIATESVTRLTIRFTPLQVPLQISGVMIPGMPQLRTAAAPLRLRCGLGDAEPLGARVPLLAQEAVECLRQSLGSAGILCQISR